MARIVRSQPTNSIATRRLLSALTQRDFALPVGAPLQHAKKVQYAEFSPDGRQIATASLDFTARIWNALTAEPTTPPMAHPDGVRMARFSPDGRRLLDAVTGKAGAHQKAFDMASAKDRVGIRRYLI